MMANCKAPDFYHRRLSAFVVLRIFFFLFFLLLLLILSSHNAHFKHWRNHSHEHKPLVPPIFRANTRIFTFSVFVVVLDTANVIGIIVLMIIITKENHCRLSLKSKTIETPNDFFFSFHSVVIFIYQSFMNAWL